VLPQKEHFTLTSRPEPEEEVDEREERFEEEFEGGNGEDVGDFINQAKN
jgi:hypothetical protein